MLKKKNAFTLVELLAVIVLLGILMLLTFPKIIEVTNSQKTRVSNAKLKLMKIATEEYLRDNRNNYPIRTGYRYCVSIKALDEGNYLTFDDEIDTSYVMKVSYLSENEVEMSYVKGTSCTEKKS